MDPNTGLDYAIFQLSPRRSRCELFISGNGKTEKLASGLLKPFITHLKVAEEKAGQQEKSIKLELDRHREDASWFSKGTLERFVRFVSTPEILELANTFDVEMSQLEGARRIYSQGGGDTLSTTSGESNQASSAAADTTKKELLRAIDVRLVAVKQDLTMASARALSAGFTPDNVSELLLFADHFGASRLNEACTKFISLCQTRTELINHQSQTQSVPRQSKSYDEESVQSSYSTDMSMDEPEVESTVASKPTDSNFLFHKPSTSQRKQLNSSELVKSELPTHVQQGSVEKQNDQMIENPVPSAASGTEVAEQSGGSSRRLSVQDRINLFESKRKEQSANSSTATCSLSRVASGKGELKRLSSDVSEKSVLKRWSGASDMSIDLSSGSSDRKENNNAALTLMCADMPSQPGSRTEEDEAGRSQDTATSQLLLGPKERAGGATFAFSESQLKGLPKDKSSNENRGTKTSVTLSNPVFEEQHRDQMSAFLCDPDASTVNPEGAGASLKYRGEKILEHKTIKMNALAALPPSSQFVPTVTEQVGWRNRESFGKSRAASPVVDDGGSKDGPSSVAQFRTFVRKEDSEVKNKGFSDSQILLSVSPQSDLQNSQFQRRMPPGELQEAWGRSVTVSQEPFEAFVVKTEVDDHTYHDTDIHGQSSASDLLKRSQGRKGGKAENESASVVPGRKIKNTKEINNPSLTVPLEQIQVMRKSKGNQELNDELQMKANELEKLFAAHRLRIQNEQPALGHKLKVQSEQPASSRRSKSSDVQEDNVPNAVDRRHTGALPKLLDKNVSVESANINLDFDDNLLLRMVDREYNSNSNPRYGSFRMSDDLKGRLYDKYMQKRNAKLQEEWESKRAQKEAKMKAMLDSLERSQAEMKAKLTGTADGQDLMRTQRRAEKLKSRNRSGQKNKDQQADESLQSYKDDLKDIHEEVDHAEVTSYSDSFNVSSRKFESKKLSSAKILSSSIPRASVAAAPKPSRKLTNTVPIKRKTQAENPLAESFPNFSDFRKENTKSSEATSRIPTRTTMRNFSGNKSINEETDIVKEDGAHRSQFIRKSTNVQGQLKDWSSPNFNGTNLATPRLSKEKIDPVYNKIQKGQEPKLLHRKQYSTGAGVDKNKNFIASEVNKTEDFEVELQNGEYLLDPINDKEEIERALAEENLETIDFSIDSEYEKPRHSQELRNSDDPGSENDDAERYLSPAGYDTAPASPKHITSSGNVQESPGESPRSWNQHHSFSYAHETSDIDAYVDSPIGSPASWNFYPLNQMMEADAARMRKKWGNAQIPVLVANASQHPRKDMTKGFKRLLKFGRKPRGIESLTSDWVSASTASEGDDDTEDGRDLTTRPSDDLRKSRMGYSLPPDDAFNEDENFPEQAQSLRSSIPIPPENFKLREEHLSGSSLKAPRSFFSLSAFRSKGSESKLR